MIIVEILLSCLIVYLLLASVYSLFLTCTYFIIKDERSSDELKKNRFVILVPAHNEELLIGKLLDNLLRINYENSLRDIVVIADNCTDKTVEICGNYPVKVFSRVDPTKGGKGYALDWALDRIDLNSYDAVMVLDADTTVELEILNELNKMLNKGEQAIQCYIKVPNRSESWFTQLIYLSRTINNLFYHYAKYKLGLSSYLMGTGMCFTTDILKKKRWTAYSLSEDWEYYAQLIEQGLKIGFASSAVVLQQESRSLQQATTQRLRWASGRFYVVKSLGFKLLMKGLVRRDFVMTDASLALIFPNWSLLINLILIAIFFSLIIPATTLKVVYIAISIGLLCIQGFILLAGVYICGDYMAMLKSIMISPVFLVWKMIIDILCLTGLYRGKKWIRTARHVPKDLE